MAPRIYNLSDLFVILSSFFGPNFIFGPLSRVKQAKQARNAKVSRRQANEKNGRCQYQSCKNSNKNNKKIKNKLAKTAKIIIFLDTTLPFNDSKQLSQVSGKVLDKSNVRF